MAYTKKTWIDNELITTSAMNNIENGIEDLNNKVPKTLSQLVNDSSFITYQEFIDNIDEYVTSQLSNVPTRTSELTNDSGFITEEDIASRLDAIPTHTSQLINDSYFVTQSFMLSQFDQLNSRLTELERIVNEMNSKVACTQISLSKASLSFSTLLTTQTLVAQVVPTDTTDIISWKTSNSSVATVDQNGVVTSVGDGSCVITATCGNCTAVCNITVAEVRPCTYLELLKTSINFTALSAKETIGFAISPNNTTDAISFRSSDTGVATVTSAGVVTSVAAGSCTITATCGSKTATCSVQVTVACTALSLNKTLLNFTSAGATAALTATRTPSNTTDTVSWKSSNTAVATVSGGTVKSVADGSCTITATCGSKKATCNVTVSTKVNYATMSISTKSLTIAPGGSKTFTINLTPSNTALDVNDISIVSSKDYITFTTSRVSQTQLNVTVIMSADNPEAGAINLLLGSQAEAVHIYIGYM